ncbi:MULTISPECIES: glycosyltransferase family 9 protein [unclassified Eikenella]|uniref:glycosyltransferase family 9 protein n=1 Tax=unclassified Eikenella TaxID=2639367 RepID=UPI0009EF4124|nr:MULTISPECIES: glycosyltransferase family 9 protein [unclassified Eikenella]VDG99366.1 lipopolysaccharide heptosyltransferase-1 [Helicobacter pametensis]
MNIPFSKKIIIRLFGQKRHSIGFDFNNIKSILIRPLGDAVGDAIINLAYAKQLKNIYSNIQLGVLVTNRNKNIFSNSPLIDKTIDRTPINYLRQRKKWDLLLDFGECLDSRSITASSILSPRAIMIFKKRARKYYSMQNVHNYDFYCPYNPKDHVVRHLHTSSFSQYFSIPEAIPELKIHLTEQISGKFWQCDTEKKIRIFLAPQGSVPFKCLPEKELSELLNLFNKNYFSQAKFIVCNTKNSEEYFKKLKLLCASDIDLSLAPKTSLEEYIALTASSDIVIGVDSGTVHLACALKKPLLSFYVDHNINTWGPLHHKDVPHFMAVSHSEKCFSESEEISWQHRGDFPIAKAANWLNQQITTILEQRNA